MKSIGKNIFVTVEKESEDSHILPGGVSLQIITEGMSNQVETTRKYGTVARENALGIPVGTVLYFHHFVVREKNWDQAYVSNAMSVDGEKLYLVNFDEDVFAYIDPSGKVVPCGNWVFIEMKKRKSTASGLILLNPDDVIRINDTGKHLDNIEEENDKGFIAFASQDILDKLKVNIGDEVITYPGLDYKIEINGKRYSRIHSADIVFRA